MVRTGLFRTVFIAGLILLLTGFTGTLRAQLNQGGVPPSTLFSLAADKVPTMTLQVPDAAQLNREDEENPSPYRFAVILPADISPATGGAWTDLPGGGRIWRIRVTVPGALALSAYFDRFRIPAGGQLFLYNEDKSRVLGAYTGIDNSSEGLFAAELVKGESLVLEYVQPEASREEPLLHLNGIAYAYRGVDWMYPEWQPQGQAGACEVNVKCMEGDNWKKQVRGVVRIQVRRLGSLYWCSGSVVNDVPCDHLPYVLTADHCGNGASASDIQQWIFYFNFESPYCPNPPVPPVPNSMTGAVLKAHGGNSGNTGSDFFLVLLNESIPDSFAVYYNGWNRKDTTSPSGVGIHHPQGDIKKISTYTTNLISSVWSGGTLKSHWKVVWSPTVNGHGVTEGGSSGSPIFDDRGRIVGTLTGGDSDCDTNSLNLPDYYGKFSWSWASNGNDSTTRLKDWLDPGNTGMWVLDGTALSAGPPLQAGSGLKVYPNPFGNTLTVETGDFTGERLHISILDLLGIPCFEKEYNSPPGNSLTLDPGDLPEGIYVLQVSDGRKMESQKIVRQKR